MRKRTFIRPFEAATYNTPYQYLQRARIESAKKAIERNAQDVFSIMDEAGYQNEIPF
jgi:transcriptional regulator GlxA family with amidase domain